MSKLRAKRRVDDGITCWRFSRLIDGRRVNVSHCYSTAEAHREFGCRPHIARTLRAIRTRMSTPEILQ